MSAIEAVKQAFANEFAFYTQTHSFHWNVEGSDFPQYHELFGNIYSDAYGVIDPLAEHMRAMGAYAPNNVGEMVAGATVNYARRVLPAREMLTETLANNATVIDSLKKAIEATEKERYYEVSNFLQDVLGKHSKWQWQLRATLKGSK